MRFTVLSKSRKLLQRKKNLLLSNTLNRIIVKVFCCNRSHIFSRYLHNMESDHKLLNSSSIFNINRERAKITIKNKTKNKKTILIKSLNSSIKFSFIFFFHSSALIHHEHKTKIQISETLKNLFITFVLYMLHDSMTVLLQSRFSKIHQTF